MVDVQDQGTKIGSGEELLAQGAASQLASQIDDWEKYKSAVGRYLKTDLLTEELISRVTTDIRDSTETIVTKLSVSLIYVLILATLVLYVFGFDPPLADGATTVEWLLQKALEFLSFFGLSEQVTGNKYVLGLISWTVAALLAETSISRELRRRTREYVEIVETTRSVVRDAKQIFVGSGQIRFSYGKLGVWVRGGNLELHIQWAAFEDADLFVWNKVGLARTDDLSAATHLFVFLKPRSDRDSDSYTSEFLVIPKRLFRTPVDANSWEDFVTNFHP